MRIEKIKNSIISFIKETSHCDEINLNDNLLGTIKSFDFMILMMRLEEVFQLNLPLEQAITNEVNTINQFIDWVEQHEQYK
jgi:acyl carrier protein